MIWTSLKKAGTDIWDELLYMIIFNVISLIGTLLVLPWPLVTFGMFEMAYDVGQGKGLKFSEFFTRPAKKWKQVYIWGGINLGLLVLIFVNINFYATFQVAWAGVVQALIIGVGGFWLILQLIMLAVYPRLETPGFREALRNAMILVARHPLAVVTLLALVIIMVVLTFAIQQCNWFVFLGLFSFPAIFSNRLVEAMIKKEFGEDVDDVQDEGMNIEEEE